MLLIGLGLTAAFARPIANWTLDHLIMWGHEGFRTITPSEVPGDALLLDVRTPEEYTASHLPGARRIDPGADATALSDVPKDRPIVTYCAIGARSAAFAERLAQAGYTDVRNLRGSIFRWAKEGRPLVNAAGPTTQVHPYDDLWGLLIDDDLHTR